jgi:hypothetical protein
VYIDFIVILEMVLDALNSYISKIPNFDSVNIPDTLPELQQDTVSVSYSCFRYQNSGDLFF